MSETRVQFLSGIFKDDTLSIDKFNCLYYAYNSSRTAFVSKKSRFSTLEEADSYLTTYNATFLSNLSNDFDNVTVNSNSVSFTGTDYKFYNLDVTFSSGSSEIDYTNILTSINTNLTNLNTNITNKNNQSDIIDCLNNIFCYPKNNNFISCFKDVYGQDRNFTVDYYKKANFSRLLRELVRVFSKVDYDYDSALSVSNLILDNISKKISFSTPQTEGNNNSIVRMLRSILLSLCKTNDVDLSSDSSIVTHSNFKSISDKLANANDLHTISQAIDLISTAIAQAPTTDTTNLEQGLTEIKESIENKDNVLLVDGTQNFVFRKEEEEE